MLIIVRKKQNEHVLLTPPFVCLYILRTFQRKKHKKMLTAISSDFKIWNVTRKSDKAFKIFRYGSLENNVRYICNSKFAFNQPQPKF